MPRALILTFAGKATAMALVVACAGCAAPAVRHVELDLGPIEGARVDAPAWWHAAGDPVLVSLLDDTLPRDRALACDAFALDAAQARETARRRRIGGRLASLGKARRAPEGPAAGYYAHAALANRRAATIAEAYLDVRLAQVRLAARQAALAPWQDNAEIARFRREAGLVSATDGSMAGVMVDLDRGAISEAEDLLARATEHLAGETGLPAEALQTRLSDATMPVVPVLVDPVPPPEPRRAGLMALRQAQAQAVLDHRTSADAARAALASATAASDVDVASAAKAVDAARALADARHRTLAQAERAARDARSAYRAGGETFAMVYVAEAAALAAREAAAQAEAGLARARVRLWTAQGLGWTLADLAPAPIAPPPATCPLAP